MPRVRYRLWMLMLLVAVAAFVLGATQTRRRWSDNRDKAAVLRERLYRLVYSSQSFVRPDAPYFTFELEQLDVVATKYRHRLGPDAPAKLDQVVKTLRADAAELTSVGRRLFEVAASREPDEDMIRGVRERLGRVRDSIEEIIRKIDAVVPENLGIRSRRDKMVTSPLESKAWTLTKVSRYLKEAEDHCRTRRKLLEAW